MRKAAILALAAALPALYILLRPGFFLSDDGRFHVYRMAALARAWSAGVLHPRLFPEFGFGYGQEVLNFYAPLSYWPGALLAALGLNPATAAEITIALGLLLAALAMFGYVRWLWGPAAGLVAAILYTYFPYHLADAFQRGAIPELLAFIFPPLILWAYALAIQAPTSSARQRALLWGTLAWAGLVFTHNLSALLMALAIIPYALMLAAAGPLPASPASGRGEAPWLRLRGVIISLILALGLTATYWLPVLAESPAVGLGLGASRGYEKHLLPLAQLLTPGPFYSYRGDPTLPIVYRLDWLSAGVLILALIAFLWRWQSKKELKQAKIMLFGLFLAFFALFMTTTASQFIWRPLTPLLGFLQYPWRFLSLAAVGVAVAGGALIPLITGGEGKESNQYSVISVHWGIVGVVFVLAMLVSLPKLPYQALPLSPADTWLPEHMWQEDADAGQIGATWTGEFLPRSVTEQRWAISRPRPNAQDTPSLPGPPRIQITSVQHLGLSLNVDTPEKMPLRLHQFQAPGWNATVDGQTADIRASTELGLTTIDLFPAGHQEVQFAFGRTASRVIGAWLSALAALLWGVWAWKMGGNSRWLRRSAAFILLITAVLMLNSAGVGRASHTPAPVQVQVGDVAQVLAADLQPARAPGYLEATIYWLALKDNATDYHVFVHVVNAAGQVVAQQDGTPVGGFTPTTRWRAGEIIQDTHHIPLPPDLPPGAYAVKTGMYAYADVIQNLPTTPPQPDNRVDLGTVTLQP